AAAPHNPNPKRRNMLKTALLAFRANTLAKRAFLTTCTATIQPRVNPIGSKCCAWMARVPIIAKPMQALGRFMTQRQFLLFVFSAASVVTALVISDPVWSRGSVAVGLPSDVARNGVAVGISYNYVS